MDATGVNQRVYLLLGVLAIASVAGAQPYDAAWTFGNVDIISYRLDAFEPADADFPDLGTENPTLPLELGKRYQVHVTNYSFHPLDIIAKAASASQDTVLLSTATQGSLESDPDVAWEDNGQGTVRFTLSASLYQAMIEGGRQPGYRCQAHPSTMRGDFTVAGLPIAERIQPSPVRVALQTVASDLTAPGLLVPDPVKSARLYVVDQAGWIRVIDRGQLVDEPLLDVTSLLVPLRENYDERGFLGLAFHPGFGDPNSPGSGRFYTYTSEPIDGPADFTLELPPEAVMDHQSVVREWQWDGVSASVDPNSSRELLRVDQPQRNHNAGHLEFGPDGYLYFTLGDGGGANDTNAGHGTIGNGQNINTIHGSVVRIDPLDPALTPDSADAVSANGSYRVPADNPLVGVEGVDEIFAYGFRNPYRFSFDARSGALIVPDVGQNRIEEINFVRRGRNYGWNIKEGTFTFIPDTGNVGPPLNDPAFSDPVAEYDHDDGIAVVGGYTHYGVAAPQLWGQYVFGDFSRAFSAADGRLFVGDLFTGKIEELLIGRTGSPLNMFVKGFGQDREGEVYLLASTALGPSGDTGVVLKIATVPTNVTAVLSGGPAGTGSAATGLTVLKPGSDAGTLSYELNVQGIENVTQAHIHVASEPGADGGVAVWLYPAAPPAMLIPGEFTSVLGAGEFSAADFVGPLAGLTLDDLFAAIEQGRAYVNVHTQQFPPGEIRGWLE
ncbi:MAG: PQQ-dependent sugar dehydrogenase [Sedimentisphaerales bacterium]|nr:PQQ-dependent sugar dehydrogenase [Sedimentisphaerales bacterium]